MGDERLRLFLALRLPDPVLDGLAAWQREELAPRPAPPGLRVVARADLHVTLAFLGSRPVAELDAIVGALRSAAAAARADLRLAAARYGETRSVAMVVLHDHGGGVRALAEDLHRRLERLGVYRAERRPWVPHVTVARFREPPRLRLEPPAMGTFVPSDAAAYLSRLRPSGAQYEVLESVALREATGG